jgi:NADPH-dependent F420 reductase
VFIGSRRTEKGIAKAEELSEELGIEVRGGDNAAACDHGVLIVVTVPYSAHRSTFESIGNAVVDKVVVDITVPLQPPKVRSVNLPEGQAAALEARALLPEGTKLVAALHHISSEHLGDPNHTFDCDVLVCGDNKEARAQVISLISDLGLRGIDAGVLKNAIALESLTPVLLHINRRYKAVGSGLRITGIPE